MHKRKKGEQEAEKILENLGVEIDATYCDDNSHESMPDIKCKDGRYIEVTHTFHNNSIPTRISKADLLQEGETWSEYNQRRLKMEEECGKALNRIRNFDYEKDETGNLTPVGAAQFKKDAKLVKDHLGYDVMERDFSKRHSEFKCDHPSITHSVENILREISEDKASKYSNGNVDLFIFATGEEFRLMKDLVSQANYNVYAKGFLHQISKSPFFKVYVCEWDFLGQEYNTVNPQLVIFCKFAKGINYEWHNCSEV